MVVEVALLFFVTYGPRPEDLVLVGFVVGLLPRAYFGVVLEIREMYSRYVRLSIMSMFFFLRLLKGISGIKVQNNIPI